MIKKKLLPAASSPSTDAQKDTAQAISRAIVVYEEPAKQRTSTIVDMPAFSGRRLHLGEGKAKEERDRQFAEDKKNGGSVPGKWASPDVQKMISSHDFFFQAEDGIRDGRVTGVQTCALPISTATATAHRRRYLPLPAAARTSRPARPRWLQPTRWQPEAAR